MPFARCWHVESDLRTEDEIMGLVVTAPTSLGSGPTDCRTAVRLALAHGFAPTFLCERRGGDGASVGAPNRDDLRILPPRAPKAQP